MSRNGNLVGRQGVVSNITPISIAKGDLILNNESGNISKALASVGLIKDFNNTTIGASVLSAPIAHETSSSYGLNGAQRKNTIELGNGQIAVGYSGDGSSISTNVNVRILDVSGKRVSKKVVVDTSSVHNISLVKLNATQFVVCWQHNSTAKMAILNNDGSIAVSPITLPSCYSHANAGFWDIAVLSNSHIVFAYAKTTTGGMAFSRYDSTGSLQGSEVLVEGSINPYGVNIVALAAGGFVLFYLRNTATQATKFTVYSNSSVELVALTTIYNTANFTVSDKICFELSNGNLLFCSMHTSTNVPVLHVYTAAGSLVKAITAWGAAAVKVGEAPGIAVFAGGFAVAYRDNSTGTGFVKFDNDGNQTQLERIVDNGGAGSSSTTTAAGVILKSIGNAGFIFLRSGYASSPSMDLRLFATDFRGSPIGTPIQIKAANSYLVYNICADIHSSGVLFLHYRTGDNVDSVMVGSYKIQRSSVLGVALQAASIGGNVNIGTEGGYALNEDFGYGGSFDNLATDIPGARGFIIGKYASLNGVR